MPCAKWKREVPLAASDGRQSMDPPELHTGGSVSDVRHGGGPGLRSGAERRGGTTIHYGGSWYGIPNPGTRRLGVSSVLYLIENCLVTAPTSVCFTHLALCFSRLIPEEVVSPLRV